MQFDQTDRREFIIVLVGGAWPIVARAQQAHMPVIGFLNPRSPDTIAAFGQGLKDTGYVEGEYVAIEYRSAEGHDDRLPALAADLVRRPVAMIAAVRSGVALVAKAATTAIPIAFAVGEDPVRLDLVTSLARPGGNLTGVNFSLLSWWQNDWGSCAELVPTATLTSLRSHCDGLASYRNTRFTYLDVFQTMERKGRSYVRYPAERLDQTGGYGDPERGSLQR
jgi:putative tryptophan/tyrosine transport system substrate-binding protein